MLNCHVIVISCVKYECMTRTDTADEARITAVIPAYNPGNLIYEAIESVLRQTLPVAEIIVVDDESHEPVGRLPPGVRLIRQKNGGVSAARNTGIQAATTPWIALLDQDDIWLPDKIQRQWEAHLTYPEAGLIGADFAEFDDDNNVQVPSFLRHVATGYWTVDKTYSTEGIAYFPAVTREFYDIGMIFFPSVMMARKDIMMAAGGFSVDHPYSQDLEFFLRVLNLTPLAVVEQPLARYRLHDAQASRNALGIYFDYLRICDKLISAPEQYPPFAAEIYRRSLPQKHSEIGRLLIEQRKPEQARRHLETSFRSKPGGRALALWVATWMNHSILDRILWVKRRLKRSK
jgi:glycosyltransferase involved in cell wall biosynthesis